ncbi:MAG: class II SORL domain-containing protein [Candidatus Omnitrophica bacterium]|nr:class II SORL domain-containing protein [Candidatus Omnitrophota bacterium]MCM8831862.1 class II SORL domain-containing protein [Candidatus Omnitrophota bacterium]
MADSFRYVCEEDILCGVRTAKDLNNLTEMEQKHLPVINAPQRIKRDEIFEVTIEVGKYKPHPNEPGHFIEWIELYSGDTFLFRLNLSGSLSAPKVTVPVKLTHAHGPLKAWAKCNLHGLWESTKWIKIDE